MPTAMIEDFVKDVFIIAPISAIRKRTRVAKMADALVNRGARIRFCGWDRKKGEAAAFRHPDTAVAEETWLEGGGYTNKRARLMYPLWMCVVFIRVLFLGRANLICLGFETAFPALLASKFTGANVVFDDADRFSMVVALPKPIHAAVQRAERWTSMRAKVHIIPGWSRYEWALDNMLVLPNSPSRSDFLAARKMARSRSDGAFVLYANGWVGETRGAPIFLQLMRELETTGLPFRMRIIGRGEGEAFDRLVARSDVDFTEEVPQVEALAAYVEADLVLTLYDPAVAINRYAESNKWGDCIYSSVPFIVNSEVLTAERFVSAGAAFSVPYNDVRALAHLIKSLHREPDRLAIAARNLDDFRKDYMPFDEVLAGVIDTAGF